MIKTIKYIACCLIGVLVLLPLQAQNIIRPKIQGPNNLWVNSYNGVLFFEQTDFETKNSAMPMQLRFYYNSSSSAVNYGFGLGFSLGFEMRYKEDVIGGVDIETGDGRIDHFVRYGDVYEAPAGVFSTLTRPSAGSYLLTTKEGDKYFFDNDVHHKITLFEDRYGNKTEYKYQDSLLVEVKDAVGHTITLSYTDGLLTQASASFSPGKVKYEYDGLRRLRKRIDPMGNVTLYDYSRQNKLDEIVDANGYKTLIAYNSSGMVSRMKTDVSDKSIRYEGDKTIFIDYTEPNNVYSYYRWDEKGRAIEKVGLCCGIQSSIIYDEDNNVAQRIDANGNVTNFKYDDRGNLLSIKDPFGNSQQFTYEPNYNKIASYRDKNGNSFTYSYDSKGNLISLSGPLGFNYYYSYDENGWRTVITDPNGAVTRINYNPDGTTASIVNADGGTINYLYDSYGRIESLTDPMGNTSSFAYDMIGRITKQTDALAHTSTATYDNVGNMVRFMDAAGNITAYTYDALGNIISKTDAMNGVTTYEIDGRGNITALEDPLGIKKKITYNDRNRINSFTNGAGEKTNYDYDAKGNLISVLQPNGNVVSYDYDELDRLIEVSDNMGLIALYEYDNNGNCISVKDGLDRKTTYAYDALNRIISETLPSGSVSTYEYDANNNLICMTDALGHKTSFTYDAMNRQTSQTDALGCKTLYVYDVNGNLTRVTDANGNITTYSYDALNQKTAITFANGMSIHYSYDELGHVINLEDRAGNVFKYDYNDLGLLLTKTYPDNSKDNYTYDADNRMLTAINKDATVSFSYDPAGRILKETLNGKTTSYSYSIAESKRTLIYPSGIKVIERFNARDLISSVIQDGEEVVTMSYNSAGQKISQTFANGITTEYGYNGNGWLETIKDDHNILSFKMDYDAIGNIIRRKNLLFEEQTESYGYDAINQIISFKRGSSINNTYEYDNLGNRISSTENDDVTRYSCNNVNAYTSINGGISFSPHYDANGNMLNDNNHSFTYNFNNKILSVDELNSAYKYDALGRMISKNGISYYYVGNQKVEEVQDNHVKSYIYGNYMNEAIRVRYNDSDYYYHLNQLKSTMAISDMSGSVIEYMDYDVFGKPSFFDTNYLSLTNSSISNTVLYGGHEYDFDSNLLYMRARNLNHDIGRFIQKDPLLYVNGLNDFSYVNNRVITYLDIFGLQKITCDPGNQPVMYAKPAPEIHAIPQPENWFPIKDKPEPKSDFCKNHPGWCSLETGYNANVCLVGGVGGCLDVGLSINADGVHLSGGITPAVGLYAGASIDRSYGANTANNDGISFQAGASAGALGVQYNANADGSSSVTGSLGTGVNGNVTVTSGSDGSIGVNGGYGVGESVGVYAGFRFGGSVTVLH